MFFDRYSSLVSCLLLYNRWDYLPVSFVTFFVIFLSIILKWVWFSLYLSIKCFFQWIQPIVQNSFVPFNELNFLAMLERLLILVVSSKFNLNSFIDFYGHLPFCGMITTYLCDNWQCLYFMFQAPNCFCWLLFFYGFFHSWCNLVGELLKFGDRVFYRDWWWVPFEISSFEVYP